MMYLRSGNASTQFHTKTAVGAAKKVARFAPRTICPQRERCEVLLTGPLATVVIARIWPQTRKTPTDAAGVGWGATGRIGATRGTWCRGWDGLDRVPPVQLVEPVERAVTGATGGADVTDATGVTGGTGCNRCHGCNGYHRCNQYNWCHGWDGHCGCGGSSAKAWNSTMASR